MKRLLAPAGMLNRLLLLSDSALKNGLHLVAGPGSGKSFFLGRILVWLWLVWGRPAVILDPTGSVRSFLLDKIIRQPIEVRKQLWSRLPYVDTGASDFVVPTPLYYRLDERDTAFAIASRLPAVLKRLDPQLSSAPILGWNSLFECAIHAGKIAAVLERQIDFVADLIAQPRVYKEELRQVLAEHPDLESSVLYFRELMDPNSAGLRERRTGSFANKLLPFLTDPTMLATFSAPQRGIDWERVVKQGQTVILDFADERDPERRQFKLLWWFRDYIDFIKHQGLAGRGQEILFVIDEVTQLLGQRTGEGHSVMADDLEELVAVLSRNYGSNTVIAHQNLSQVDERVNNVLMQMGTQMIGRIANPDDALYLARQFWKYSPYQVKKEEPVWMSVQHGMGPFSYSVPEVIDWTTTEFTPEEQLIQMTDKFRFLPKFQFLVRPALEEGNIGTRLKRVSIANFDRNQYPDEEQITQVRAYLRQRCGIPLEEILADIDSHRKAEQGSIGRRKPVRQKQVKSVPHLAILKDEEDTTDAAASHHLSTTASTVLSADSAGAGHSDSRPPRQDDDFWR